MEKCYFLKPIIHSQTIYSLIDQQLKGTQRFSKAANYLSPLLNIYFIYLSIYLPCLYWLRVRGCSTSIFPIFMANHFSYQSSIFPSFNGFPLLIPIQFYLRMLMVSIIYTNPVWFPYVRGYPLLQPNQHYFSIFTVIFYS